MITLTNEISGVITASMKSIPMNIMISLTGLRKRHIVRCRAIFLSVMTIKIPKPKMIRIFDENSIPITNIAIQSNENIKLPIAVIGSITSLCSSVYLYFQDGGENLSGNLAKFSNLYKRRSIDC
jgi:hypothetical protein